jgi:hypothetical protein
VHFGVVAVPVPAASIKVATTRFTCARCIERQPYQLDPGLPTPFWCMTTIGTTTALALDKGRESRAHTVTTKARW